jgi:hypothetical protein
MVKGKYDGNKLGNFSIETYGQISCQEEKSFFNFPWVVCAFILHPYIDCFSEMIIRKHKWWIFDDDNEKNYLGVMTWFSYSHCGEKMTKCFSLNLIGLSYLWEIATLGCGHSFRIQWRNNKVCKVIFLVLTLT